LARLAREAAGAAVAEVFALRGEDLETLADGLYLLSNCGLGQTAATPIRDILRHFGAEVDAHVRLNLCPTGACPMSGRLAKAA
jgi:hypothetical protein